MSHATASSRGQTWALLLKKAPGAAKSRLAAVLNEAERAQVVERLFRHVLDRALTAAALQRVAVISPEQPALPDGVLWLRDRTDNMNDCVRQGLAELTTLGAARVLILPADLPLLTSADLDDLLGAGGARDMVIAPDDRDAGTNGLLLPVPTAFNPHFGSDSFHRHLAEAGRLGIAVQVLRRPGLAFDLDDQQDWRWLCREHQREAATLTG